LAKPNYHHARRQKELARKTKQQEKQQKRAAAREPTATDDVKPAAPLDVAAPHDPNSLSDK
jgi:sRNA-binding protein